MKEFSITKTDTERIQVAESEYKGKTYYGMRIWYLDSNTDTWKPTKKGFNLTAEKFKELVDKLKGLTL